MCCALGPTEGRGGAQVEGSRGCEWVGVWVRTRGMYEVVGSWYEEPGCCRGAGRGR